MDPLRIAGAIASATAAVGRSEAAPEERASFADALGSVLSRANADLRNAEGSAEALARGETDVVETMIALSRADLSLRLVLSLRNRALEAYQEVMRLQV